MEECILKTKGLYKSYGKNMALEDVSVSVPTKSIYGLVGENGAGKTTLFRILSGVSQQTAGTFALMQSTTTKEILKARRKIGFMIETPAFYPNMLSLINI